MAQRITILIDDEILKKLRQKQAKLLKDSIESVSFSKVINEELKKALK